MMPQITISQPLYEKLKGMAEPFVDTPEMVIARCVDFYASNHKAAAAAPAEAGTVLFPAESAPDLTFTRPLAIKIDGASLEKKDLYWNALMFDVVGRAAAKLNSVEKLKQFILVNYVVGEAPQEKGYRFVQAAGLSVQGQDSNAAWKAIMHLVKATGMSIDVTFMWENKDKAAYPGKTARMVHKG